MIVFIFGHDKRQFRRILNIFILSPLLGNLKNYAHQTVPFI
jgi:hypothetical protein